MRKRDNSPPDLAGNELVISPTPQEWRQGAQRAVARHVVANAGVRTDEDLKDDIAELLGMLGLR